MELLPKKATEKIGEAIRKKLPKKLVGLAGCENGLFKKGSGRLLTEWQSVEILILPVCHVTDCRVRP